MNTLQWEITLADDSIKKESLGDNFSLDWEGNNSIKKIVMKGIGDITDEYEVDFSTGIFKKNSEQIDAGIGNAQNLVFRKRTQVRVAPSGGDLPRGIIFIVGYNNVSNNKKMLKIEPVYTIGTNEPTGYVYTVIDSL